MDKSSAAPKPALPEWLVVGFSGHRNIPDPVAVAAKIGEELDRLAAEHGSLAVVSSAARGADTLFLEEAAKRKLPTIIILPNERGEFETSFSSVDLGRVRPLLEGALRVEEISATGDDAYLEAGERTIDLAEVVLLVWDGNESAGPGGTGDAAKHAELTGKPCIHIERDTLAVERTNFEKWRRKGKKFSAARSGEPRKALEEFIVAADKAARADAWWTRELVLVLILIHLVASATGMCVPVFQSSQNTAIACSTVELLLLLLAASVLVRKHHRRHSHWLSGRIEVEVCRSCKATWDLTGQFRTFGVTPFPGYEPLFNNLRLLRAQDTSQTADVDGIRNQYLHDRVKDQITYFEKEWKLAKSRLALLSLVVAATTSGALTMTAITLWLHWLGREDVWSHIAKYLSLVLPLVSAAVFSFILTNEYARRKERYDEMVQFLKEVESRLVVIKTPGALARIASKTEEVLLREVIEWHSFTRFAGRLH